MSTHCLSPYPSREDLTTSQRFSLIIAFTLITPMTLLFNGALIYGLYKTNQYRNVFSRFIMILSLSDFCIGLFVQPVVIYLFIPGNERDCMASWYLTLSGYVLLNFSGLVIFMVSIDRYFRLRKTHGYTQKVTIQRVNIALASAFIFSVFTSAAAYVSAIMDFFCIFNMVIIVVNFISAAGILNFYFFAWRSVRKRIASIRNISSSIIGRSRLSSSTSTQDAMDDEQQKQQQENEQQQQMKKSISTKSSIMSVLSKSRQSLIMTFSNSTGNKRVRSNYDAAMTRTVAAILVCCCTTYPPYFIVSFYRSVVFTMEGYCNRESHPTNIWFFWSFFLMFLNCVVNVVLYSCHNRQLKDLMVKEFNRLMGCCGRYVSSSTSSDISKDSVVIAGHATICLKDRPTFV